jgi:hypothetical protein
MPVSVRFTLSNGGFYLAGVDDSGSLTKGRARRLRRAGPSPWTKSAPA